jgi:hypothetical protein
MSALAIAGALGVIGAAAGADATAGPMGNTKWGDIELGAAPPPAADAWIPKIEIGA